MYYGNKDYKVHLRINQELIRPSMKMVLKKSNERHGEVEQTQALYVL